MYRELDSQVMKEATGPSGGDEAAQVSAGGEPSVIFWWDKGRGYYYQSLCSDLKEESEVGQPTGR